MHSEIQARSLADLVDALQAGGRYVLRQDEALATLGVSSEALRKAAQRLAKKGRLAIPRQGFYVIVPLEYRSAGAPPPDWYIEDLMLFLGVPYYVGLLSAAALHGAAHQQPQEFQVVAASQLRPAAAGRARIRFFKKKHMERTPTVAMKTETGFIKVSTPEATALDLVRYAKTAGQIGNVATVLSELSERLAGDRLLEAARADGDVSTVQRLGYLLDHVGSGSLTDDLAAWVQEQRPRSLPLRADIPAADVPLDPRWRLLINDRIEVDE